VFLYESALGRNDASLDVILFSRRSEKATACVFTKHPQRDDGDRHQDTSCLMANASTSIAIALLIHWIIAALITYLPYRSDALSDTLVRTSPYPRQPRPSPPPAHPTSTLPAYLPTYTKHDEPSKHAFLAHFPPHGEPSPRSDRN
jgi:hypothetical protein